VWKKLRGGAQSLVMIMMSSTPFFVVSICRLDFLCHVHLCLLSSFSQKQHLAPKMPYPKIFIPTKGRASGDHDDGGQQQNKKKTTPKKKKDGAGTCCWKLLVEADLPLTLVVEPQEHADYAKAVLAFCKEKTKDPKLVSFAVLRESHQGVGYARQCIFREFASQDPNVWSWMLDDDLQNFARCFTFPPAAADDNKGGEVMMIDNDFQPAAFFSEIEERLHSTVLKQFPRVVLVGTNTARWLSIPKRSNFSLNLACNQCFCFCPGRISDKVQFRLAICEDKDFALQVIREGGMTCSFRDIGYKAPAMGESGRGGMTDFYKDAAKIASGNKAFLELWPQVAFDKDEVYGEGTDTRRIKGVDVDWRLIQPALPFVQADYDAAIRFYLPRPDDCLVLRPRGDKQRHYANYHCVTAASTDVAEPLHARKKKRLEQEQQLEDEKKAQAASAGTTTTPQQRDKNIKKK
jgi:hypothetical protein